MGSKFRKITADKIVIDTSSDRTVEAGILNLSKFINFGELAKWFSKALEGFGLRRSIADITKLANGKATSGGKQFINQVMTGTGKEFESLQPTLQGLLGRPKTPLPAIFDEMGKVIKPSSPYSLRNPIKSLSDFISNTVHGFSPKRYKELMDDTLKVEVPIPHSAGGTTIETPTLGELLKNKTLFSHVDWTDPINKSVLNKMAKYHMERQNSNIFSNALNWGSKGYLAGKGYQAWNNIFHPEGDTDAGVLLEDIPGGGSGGWSFPGGPSITGGEENGRPPGSTPLTEDWEPLDISKADPRLMNEFMPVAQNNKFRRVTAEETPQSVPDSITMFTNLVGIKSKLPAPEDMQKIIESAMSLNNPDEIEKFLAVNLFRPYGSYIDIANQIADSQIPQQETQQNPVEDQQDA